MFNPLSGLFGLFSRDIGIDLGTANTLVLVRGKGIVVNEPSVVAINRKTRRVLAVGREAKRMYGLAPRDILVIRPLKDGVIYDFDVTEQLLRHFIERAHADYPVVPRARVVVGIPSGVTEVEKRAVHDATMNAGTREAWLIEEPMAAAIGAGLPITEPAGCMIVDIGGGTTEVAVISLGGMVAGRSIRIAGDEMDQEIVNFMVAEAISGSVRAISDAVADTLEETPPELLADLMSRGITLAGGGAQLPGLPDLLTRRTKIMVHVADEPLGCVVRGTGRVLNELDDLRKVLVDLGSPRHARVR
jgi:rod shape-determining protein MreB